MYKVVGIDEAGKGPVIGSMFIGFSIINLPNGINDLNSYQDSLKEIGVVDSKKLSPKKRNAIYVQLKDKMDITYAQLTPHAIDSNFDSGKTLHELEIEAIAKVLNQIKPDLILIDALTSNPEMFSHTLQKELSFECKIISENKADMTYPIVSAASIAAKELREQELAEIESNVKQILSRDPPNPANTGNTGDTVDHVNPVDNGDTEKGNVNPVDPVNSGDTEDRGGTVNSGNNLDTVHNVNTVDHVNTVHKGTEGNVSSKLSSLVGSGYPSDKITQEFIKNHWNNEEIHFIFRKCWKTYQNLVNKDISSAVNGL